jgi:hypothetical protein
MATEVSKCFDISLDSEVTAARGSSQAFGWELLQSLMLVVEP